MYLAFEKILFIYFSQFKRQQDGPNDHEQKIYVATMYRFRSKLYVT